MVNILKGIWLDKKPQPVRVTVEMSADMHQWLTKQAEAEHRTLQGQLAHIIQRHRRLVCRGPVPVIRPGSVVAMEKVG